MEDKKYTAYSIKALSQGEHIRMRPRLYFEKCFSDGALDALPPEAACHALDEYFDGNCSTLKIIVSDEYFTVEYDAGMSLGLRYGAYMAEDIMTKIGACSNHKKHLTVGEEFCELGIATINFASAKCCLITISNGQKGIFDFEKGETIKRAIEQCSEAAKTSITFYPDPMIFGSLKITTEGIKTWIALLKQRLENLNVELELK